MDSSIAKPRGGYSPHALPRFVYIRECYSILKHRRPRRRATPWSSFEDTPDNRVDQFAPRTRNDREQGAKGVKLEYIAAVYKRSTVLTATMNRGSLPQRHLRQPNQLYWALECVVKCMTWRHWLYTNMSSDTAHPWLCSSKMANMTLLIVYTSPWVSDLLCSIIIIPVDRYIRSSKIMQMNHLRPIIIGWIMNLNTNSKVEGRMISAFQEDTHKHTTTSHRSSDGETIFRVNWVGILLGFARVWYLFSTVHHKHTGMRSTGGTTTGQWCSVAPNRSPSRWNVRRPVTHPLGQRSQ